MLYKIALFGPQGSGKGTQAEKIQQQLNLPIITPGNIFRQHIQSATEIGQKVKTILAAGNLVPDQITNQIIINRLQAADCQAGFILDGFPRNLIQAKALNQWVKLNYVILINISDQAAIERISRRWMCHCGASYHEKYKPEFKNGICDRCGEKLYQRDDDTKEKLAVRLKIYHSDTEPVLAGYQAQKILHSINGERTIAEVWQDVSKILAL